jgi:hypothetical protein
VNWALNGNQLEMELEIPVGMEAEVILPAFVNYYKIDGEEYELDDMEEKRVGLKSGKYKISYNRSHIEKNQLISNQTNRKNGIYRIRLI